VSHTQGFRSKSLIHFTKFFFGLEPPASQVTQSEMRLLLKYSEGARCIVELGCFEGKTSAALAAGNASLDRLYSIDPFFKGRVGICYGEWIARLHCKRLGAKSVQFKKGFSFDIAPFVNEEIDLLFIDADHDYDAVTRDWRDWVPKVKKGGYVALHDCIVSANSPRYLGSMKFYDNDIRLMNHVTERDTADSLAVFQVW
jgi:predicted O-methyltransferase YrrM